MNFFRLTIRKKLNLIVIGLQIATVAGIITLATYLFTEDLPGVLRKTNFDVASILASRVRSEFKLATDRMHYIGAVSLEEFKVEDDKFRFLEDLISADSKILAVSLYEVDSGASGTPVAARWRVINPSIHSTQQLNTSVFAQIDKTSPLDFNKVSRGETDIKVAALNGATRIRLAVPFYEQSKGLFTQYLVAELNPDMFAGLFNEAAAYTILLIDSSFKIVASNEAAGAKVGSRIDDKLRSILSQSEMSQARQVDYKEKNENTQMASIHPVRFAGLTIIAQAPYDRIERAKQTLYKRTALLNVSIVCLSIWLAILFSSGFKDSVVRLAEAADLVARGDYQVRLPVKKHGLLGLDELEEFSETFNKMVTGLEERNKVKSAFSKLHSKDVAEKLIHGDLKLGGERKNCIVFFADIRGFTAMSEKMDPEHIVSILNRYFTVVIRIIDRFHGNVTGFQGDGIMAVWGIGTKEGPSADVAIKACLEIRVAIAKLNEELLSEGRQALRIGMGLHYGSAIVGNIGSNTRMEFTVIGDTTNTASRVESATKEFGTDMLVSEELLEQTRTMYIVEKVSSHVKGKAQELTLYKIHGYIDGRGEKILVQTPYSEYAVDRPQKNAYGRLLENLDDTPDET